MRIFITGGSGFIGKNAREYFGKKHTIFAPTHRELDLVDANAVSDYVKANNIDIILHCANRGGTRYTVDRVIEDNLSMFLNLARASKDIKRMIYYGSGAEFDKSRSIKKVKEVQFGERVPKDDYGFSKYMLNIYTRNSNNIVNLRIFGAYGKDDHYEYRFFSNAIVKNLLKMDITIYQNIVMDFLYIADILKITEYFIDNDAKHKDYNLAPYESTELVKATNMINGLAEEKSKISVLKPGLNLEYTADNSRLIEELGSYKFMGYEEAIADLYGYYKTNLDKINKDLVLEDPYLKTFSAKR